jgi:hypothetical protein
MLAPPHAGGEQTACSVDRRQELGRETDVRRAQRQCAGAMRQRDAQRSCWTCAHATGYDGVNLLWC